MWVGVHRLKCVGVEAKINVEDSKLNLVHAI